MNQKHLTTDTLSLRELCHALGISRRTIQGYETGGLLSPSGKNALGHLYYDEEAQSRAKQIREYQLYGFSVKEIDQCLRAPRDKLLILLEDRFAKLCRDREQAEAILLQLQEKIKKLSQEETV